MPEFDLTSDRRARIPFALLGVLLLTSSVAYGAGIATQGPTEVDRSVERAIDRADGDADAAVRDAVRSAAADAAREPVTRSTERGTDAVRPNSPFRDALRIRIGLAAAERLPGASAKVDDVVATPELGTGNDPTAENLTRVRERVRIEGVANGTALEVTIDDVTVVAERDGEVVARETREATVTVATPVLAAHERTEQFETRLNRGPIEGPGLGRQLTARLYPVVWARGYGQYAGTPIQNVLANRHVELSTNTGIRSVQRSTFGTDDHRGREGVRIAAARTGLEDLLAPTELDGERWSDVVLDAGGDDAEATIPEADQEPAESSKAATDVDPLQNDNDSTLPSEAATDTANPSPNETTSIEVGHTADVAFLEALDRMDEQFRRTYRVEGERVVRITEIDATPVSTAVPPDEPANATAEGNGSTSTPAGWSLANEDREVEHAVVVETDRRTATDASATLTVERQTTVSRTWVGGNETRETTATGTRTFRAFVDVSVAHAPTDVAPDRTLSDPLEDPALRDASERAVDRLVDDDDGFESIALREVSRLDGGEDREQLGQNRVVVHADPPAGLRDRVYDDVRTLREDVRSVDVEAERGGIATGAESPEAALAERVDDRRQSFVGAPDRYADVDDRARVAVRAVFLEELQRELDHRADREAETRGALADVLEDAGAPGIDRLEGIREARTAPMDRVPEPAGEDGPGGAVAFEPVGSPGYLPRTPIDASHSRPFGADEEERRTESRTPLATRNVNYFTLPHGELADGIVDRVLGTGRTVDLDRAGRTLSATNATLEHASDPELRKLRDELAAEVEEGMNEAHREADTVLREETDLSARERREAIAAADRRYDGLGERAMAVGNGSYAETLAAAAHGRTSDAGRARAGRQQSGPDELAVRLRVATQRAADRETAEVPDEPVTDAATRVRAIARDSLSDALEDGIEEGSDRAREHWGNDVVAATPAGLPIAPVPGYWYATTNVWRVQVRGTYPRFSVRASGGTAHEEPIEYVRESGTVTVDVDGEPVTLGETEPVTFETETAIAIAVPPKAGGVGDVDGVADERSPGWEPEE
ncbi:hypothetical protein RH858_09635 [Halalkaliarchaeum sp. AArc-GB]|uniref:DUF7286 family protein n=1 Tax=Halalkaliarchaeum sp. AArc-GB TaxID=3074078 RepID=UPI00286708DF|nr:hypothetical protein [Halalkaliarchaeum sp. AArc-GB]MDR5673406.1 hypothetical protein [Halalkaliarchaeum sp. AArc-GB]